MDLSDKQSIIYVIKPTKSQFDCFLPFLSNRPKLINANYFREKKHYLLKNAEMTKRTAIERTNVERRTFKITTLKIREKR